MPTHFSISICFWKNIKAIISIKKKEIVKIVNIDDSRDNIKIDIIFHFKDFHRDSLKYNRKKNLALARMFLTNPYSNFLRI